MKITMTFNPDNAAATQEPKQADGFAVPRNHKRIGAQALVGTFATSVFIQGCTVLQAILIARLLGPVGRGEYAAVILWPAMFAGLGIFGSNIAIARASAKLDDHGKVLRTAIVLSFITSAISSLVCFIVLPLLMPQAESHLVNLARVFVLFIPINHLGLNLLAVDQGSGNFRNFNFTRAILNPLYVTILVWLWLLGIREVRWFVIALLIGNLAVVVVRLFLAIRKYSILGKLYSLASLVKQSVHFGLAGIAQPLYLQADKALILWLLGAKNLGLYMVALSASAVIGSITNSAGMVSFTMAAQANKGGGFQRVAKTFRISVLLWLFFGGILAAVMPFVLPLVYGRNFTDAVNPARLLIIGSAFAGLANMLEQSVRGQGKAFIGLEGRFAGLVIMAISGLFLAGVLGLTGMCLAYIAGQLVCLVVIIWRSNRHYSVKAIDVYMPGLADFNYIFNKLFQCVLVFVRT